MTEPNRPEAFEARSDPGTGITFVFVDRRGRPWPLLRSTLAETMGREAWACPDCAMGYWMDETPDGAGELATLLAAHECPKAKVHGNPN